MVDRDALDWAFDILGAVGGLAGVFALWYTARARREIAAERVRVFELEILREIASEIDDGFLYRISEEPHRLRKFARRLDLLPGRDLPFWREVIAMQWPMNPAERQRELSQLTMDLAKRQPPQDAPEEEQATWKAEHAQAVRDLDESAHYFREGVSQRLLDELIEAIIVRVQDGSEDGRWGRLRRWWRFGV
jgi:hypothetical protein